jgi:hypothetical protein
MEVLVEVRVGASVKVAWDVGMDMEMAVGSGVAVGTQAIASRRESEARAAVLTKRFILNLL